MIAQVVGERLSTILGRNVTDKWRIGFTSQNPQREVNLDEAVELWTTPVAVILRQSERFLDQVDDVPARITQEFVKEFSSFVEFGLKWGFDDGRFEEFADRVGT